MASNSNQAEEREEEEEEEEEEEDGDEEEEDDDEYDPEAEALNAALAASLEDAAAAAEAWVVEGLSEVEIIEAVPNQGDRERENEEEEGEEERDDDDDEEERGKCAIGGSELDQAAAWPNCTICLDPWTSDGPHRVCCIPCGHVYGNSCLEKWLRCRKSTGKCPQCNREFKLNEIINLHASLIVVPNDDLEKEVRSLREDNEIFMLENSRLQEEIRKQKMDRKQMRQVLQQTRQLMLQMHEQQMQYQEQMQQLTRQMHEQLMQFQEQMQQQMQQSHVVQQQILQA